MSYFTMPLSMSRSLPHILPCLYLPSERALHHLLPYAFPFSLKKKNVFMYSPICSYLQTHKQDIASYISTFVPADRREIIVSCDPMFFFLTECFIFYFRAALRHRQDIALYDRLPVPLLETRQCVVSDEFSCLFLYIATQT